MVAAGRQFRAGDNIKVRLNNPGFVEMRKDPKLVSLLQTRGETWVARLNEELHLAQKARKQPIADGYTHYVHTTGSRARLYIVAFTARAQAHEKKHSSILKLMEISGYDVKKFADLTPQQQTASMNARAKTKRKREKTKDLGAMTDAEFKVHMGKKAAKGTLRKASPTKHRWDQ